MTAVADVVIFASGLLRTMAVQAPTCAACARLPPLHSPRAQDAGPVQVGPPEGNGARRRAFWRSEEPTAPDADRVTPPHRDQDPSPDYQHCRSSHRSGGTDRRRGGPRTPRVGEAQSARESAGHRTHLDDPAAELDDHDQRVRPDGRVDRATDHDDRAPDQDDRAPDHHDDSAGSDIWWDITMTERHGLASA